MSSQSGQKAPTPRDQRAELTRVGAHLLPSASTTSMASSHPHQSNVLLEELTCPVCLDVYHDPHLLPCGHNFCKTCLDRLRHEADRGRFRCPECRISHRCSISFQRNFKLANIADDFRSRRRASSAAADSADRIAKASFPCDYCLPPSAAASDDASGSAGDTPQGAGASVMAVRMCLKCEVCMCQEHVKPHLELPAFREHPLTEPTSDLWKRKCRDHDELFKYYCLDDKVCVCNACTVEGRHLGHTMKTLKNTMKDLKMVLDKKMRRVGKEDSLAKQKLREQKQKENQNKLIEDSEECLARLRQELEGKVDGFVGRLLECSRGRCETSGPAIRKNISRICQDMERLREVRCGIAGLQQENDPLCFLEACKTTGRRCSRLLRKDMFYPEYVDMELELLGVMMEEEMRKFLDEEIPCYIVAAINSICRLTNVEEADRRSHTQEATRDTDDEDDEEDDYDDVLDDSSEGEMRSEEEEEDEVRDPSELAEDLYIPEEVEEEEEEDDGEEGDQEEEDLEEEADQEEEEEDQEEEEEEEEEEDYEDDEDVEERRG
uniref:probable E3 ubiquitin-protein ligase MID2 isoform X2 n=1 Tax=Doryrhamphus excisus TaxID=161450 RepID=UPI0025AE008C|nr:probable E3 ubiquitin-protein ligase MID2 isoform X2 [Doryrhamphus excisus]